MPFCQLTKRNGPLATSIELRYRSLKFWPAILWAGYGDVATSASHAAYAFPFFHVTVTDLPATLMLAMSSQPSREVMSKFGFMIVWYVALKSLPVICRPSLHFAFALYLKETVSGLALTIFGAASTRYGTSFAFWL